MTLLPVQKLNNCSGFEQVFSWLFVARKFLLIFIRLFPSVLRADYKIFQGQDYCIHAYVTSAIANKRI